MQKQRDKRPGVRQYYIWRFTRSDLLDLPQAFLEAQRDDLMEDFACKLRRRHMYTNRVFWVDFSESYDITYDQHKWIFEEHPKPWKRIRYTFLTVSQYGVIGRSSSTMWGIINRYLESGTGRILTPNEARELLGLRPT